MKKLATILIFILPWVIINAQDFEQGYILTNDQETIPGLVRVQSNQKMQNVCLFKRSGDAEIIIYSPGQIIGFGIGNTSFRETLTVQIDDYNQRLLFLERLVIGRISLFRYFDNDEVSFFLHKEGQNTGRRLIPGEPYLGVLNTLMDDCAIVKNEIRRVDYNEESLRVVLDIYNSCSWDPQQSTEYVIENQRSKAPGKLYFGPVIGGGIDALKIKESSGSYLDLVAFDSRVSPTLGFGLRPSFPSAGTEFSLDFQVLYQQRIFKGESEEFVPPDITERNVVLLEMHSVSIPVMFRIATGKGNMKHFVQFGLLYRFLFTQSNINLREQETGNIVILNEDEVFEAASGELGFGAGIGSAIPLSNNRLIEAGLRFETGAGVDNAQTAITGTQMIRFTLSYLFAK